MPGRPVRAPTDASRLEPAESTDDLVGVVIADRYLITEKLGAGGMGRVYLAQHVRLPKQAAIKVLHPSLVHDAGARDRFKEEAERTCRIRDPHVAQVYDFGETADGLVYLEMEFVEGEALSALLAREGALSPARAAEIVRQAAEGLTAAHEIGIVHRDLKPDNIMVGANRDGTDCIKVVDFGIAKAIQGEPSKHTQTGMVIGTPEYMSPDQLSTMRLDARSDIYSLGLVAFVMLTGQLPFGGETPQDGMWRRLSDPPRTLRATKTDVDWPPSVQAVMDRALARSRDDRYAAPNDFARDLVREIAAWQSPADVAGPVAARARKHEHARWGILASRRAAIAGAVLLGVVATAAGLRIGAGAGTRPDDSLTARETTTVKRAATGAVVDSGTSRSRSADPRASTTDGRASGKRDSAAHATRVMTPVTPVVPRLVVGPPSGRADSASRQGSAESVRAELQRLEALLANPYAITPDVARAARAGIDTLLPLLRSQEDSVAARYHAAELDLVLTADPNESAARQTDACRHVTAIKERARTTRFDRRIQRLLDRLGCD